MDSSTPSVPEPCLYRTFEGVSSIATSRTELPTNPRSDPLPPFFRKALLPGRLCLHTSSRKHTTTTSHRSQNVTYPGPSLPRHRTARLKFQQKKSLLERLRNLNPSRPKLKVQTMDLDKLELVQGGEGRGPKDRHFTPLQLPIL